MLVRNGAWKHPALLERPVQPEKEFHRPVTQGCHYCSPLISTVLTIRSYRIENLSRFSLGC
jgi:hypothetical protein